MKLLFLIPFFIVATLSAQENRTQSIDCDNYDLWAVDQDGVIHQYKLNYWNIDNVAEQCVNTSLAIGSNQYGVTTYLTHQGGVTHELNSGVWENINTGPLSGVNMGAYHKYKYTVTPWGSQVIGIDSLYNAFELIELTGELIITLDVAVDSLGNAWVITGWDAVSPCEIMYVISPEGIIIKQYSFPNFMDHHWFDGLTIVGNRIYASKGYNELYEIGLGATQAFVNYAGQLNIGGSDVADLASCKPGNPGGFGVEYTSSENHGEESIHIYPNPASDLFKIECAIDSQIEIYSLDGQFIESLVTKNFYTSIDTQNYPAGSYVIKIINKEQLVSTHKLSIIH